MVRPLPTSMIYMLVAKYMCFRLYGSVYPRTRLSTWIRSARGNESALVAVISRVTGMTGMLDMYLFLAS